MILVIYHRNAKTYSDQRPVTNVEPLYTNYINSAGGISGVPDVFINGPLKRVQGASSPDNVYERTNLFINEIIKELAFFTIEADIKEKLNQIEVTYRISTLGFQSAKNLLLRILFITDHLDLQPFYNYSVSQIIDPITISQIDAGEFVEETIILDKVPQAQRIVLLLSDKDQQEIYYAIEKDIL